MTRRDFFKLSLSLTTFLAPFKASANSMLRIIMKGDLDDDLFVVRTKGINSQMLECMQMHNPRKRFNYNGVTVESKPIYGMIDFKNSYNLDDNEILTFFVANEREELYDLPKLNMRTHFRAVDLIANNQTLIPELLPEHNNVPNYPTWYGNEDEYCKINGQKTVNYNYYKLWENAICGAGIIIKNSSVVEIKLYSNDNELLFEASKEVTKKTSQLEFYDVLKNKPFNKHLLAEVDGCIFGSEHEPNDEYVKQYAIHKAIVTVGKKDHVIVFPYPFPYPNRLYIKSIF